MAKDPKPNTRSYGSYTQMFLDDENKHFIDAERALPYNEVLSWGGRKHSEGMMPFMGDDGSNNPYATMDYLWPNIPPWQHSSEDISDILSQGEEEDYAAYRFYCEIVCEAMVRDCFNDDPIRCYYGAVTGDGDIDRWSVISGPSNVTFSHDGDDVLVKPNTSTWAGLGGGSFDIGFEYRDSGHSKDTWFYHPLMDKWILILAGSSVCYDSTAFRCCPAEEHVAFDEDATADTIEPGGEAALVITGGLPPYEWSVGNTGYSLRDDVTWGLDNVLYAIDAECGEGLDPYCIVTVVDACDEVATNWGVRNTEGHWGDWTEVIALTYNDLCDEKTCDTAGPYEGGKTVFVDSTDGIYGYRKYQYGYHIASFPTCKAGDPDDCCGNASPYDWNCGYSKNPARGALCNYYDSYGPATTVIITGGGYDAICDFDMDEALWEC